MDNAHKYGCIGVIIYSDPQQVAPNGTEPENVYPETIFLPGSGIQRGNLAVNLGDPDTPSWPSIEDAYRQVIINYNGVY